MGGNRNFRLEQSPRWILEQGHNRFCHSPSFPASSQAAPYQLVQTAGASPAHCLFVT